jgi:hypothetical protein
MNGRNEAMKKGREYEVMVRKITNCMEQRSPS